MAPLLESRQTQDFDILAIQEPWTNPFQPTTYNPANSQFYLAYPPEAGRACLYINKRLDLNSWQYTSASPDVSTVSLTLKGLTIHIHNLYSQPPGNYRNTTYKTPLTHLPELLQAPGEYIVLGDFNLHHPMWNGPQTVTQHEAADQLLDSVMQANLQLLLPPGSTTWEARGGRSTIDLVFGSDLVANRLIECKVRQDLDQGSDHLPIATILALEPQLAPPSRKRNWKKMNLELITKEAQALRRLGAGETPEEIEWYTTYLLNFAQALVERIVP